MVEVCARVETTISRYRGDASSASDCARVVPASVMPAAVAPTASATPSDNSSDSAGRPSSARTLMRRSSRKIT